MKKNILMLTNLYPSWDIRHLNSTAVCHYFAKEWVALGYNVKVIYNINKFPWLYYPGLRILNKFLAARNSQAIMPKRITKSLTYDYEGVNVTRIPISKKRPKGGFTDEELKCHFLLIEAQLREESFVPDVIVGHFLQPSLQLVAMLSESFNIPSAVILHGQRKEYSADIAGWLKNITYVGFRSKVIKENFEKIYGIPQNNFICPSGVPEHYILKGSKKFSGSGTKLKCLYVGNLMKRKHPIAVLDAFYHSKIDFTLSYVGDGGEEKKLRRHIYKYRLDRNVFLKGRIPRDEVMAEMENADLMILISENETFGLVYLEAMAKGCIVIAAKDEGMDGIIENGINGFLCEAGNPVELSRILVYISQLSVEDKQKISEASLATARKYTDKNVAKLYLENINMK